MALIKATGVKLTPAFDVYLNANQTGITDQAQNLVKFNGEYFDTHNAFDTTDGQNKFTVPSGKEGKYFFYAGIDANPNANNQTQEANLSIYKNGSLVSASNTSRSTEASFKAETATVSDVIYLDGKDDYLELWALVRTSGTPVANTSRHSTFLSAVLVSGGSA